ncbi:hypothetical protein ACYSNM_10970 [Myroides sp. LJL116]
MYKKIGIFFLLIFVVCCSKPKDKEDIENTISFYYWKTIFNLKDKEKEYLKDFNSSKLYVRYLDIGLKNGKAIPIAPIIFKDSLIEQNIIPVVYIKNEVMLKKDIDLGQLAHQIVDFIDQINKKNNLSINEIQLDCDWTLQSKQAFFSLIDHIKKSSNKRISCTIRLHQIKYANKTGIPNVDYGVLMYYNMSAISNDTLNSIYNREVAKSYIGNLKNYPLPLSYALPIYSWVVISQKDKVVGLLNGMSIEDLKNNPLLVAKTANIFVAKDQTMVKNKLIQKGQELKLEHIKEHQLQEMIQDLKQNAQSSTLDILLYDLNEINLSSYEKQTLQDLVYH